MSVEILSRSEVRKLLKDREDRRISYGNRDDQVIDECLRRVAAQLPDPDVRSVRQSVDIKFGSNAVFIHGPAPITVYPTDPVVTPMT